MSQDAATVTGLFRVIVLAAALSLLPVAGQAAFIKLDPVPGDLADPPRQSLETKRASLLSRLSGIKGRGNAFNAKCKSVEEGSTQERDCRSELKELQGLKVAYNRDAGRFNATLGAAKEKVKARWKKAVMGFFASVAAVGEKLVGASAPSAKEYEARKKEYETRKKDALRRFKEAHERRQPCRAKKVACSKDGKAYDPEEGIRRRTHQYLVWGELSYYIRFEDFREVYGKNISNKEKGVRMLGLAAVKAWPWGGEMGYIIAKDIEEYGSTPPGGGGSAQKGLKKAFNHNKGFKP